MVGVILGVAAAGLHVLGYLIYMRSVLRKAILPNAASYLMFAYGTTLVVFLALVNGASAPQLILPVFCAAMSVAVALLSLRRGGTEPTDTTERVIFCIDVVLTIAYLGLAQYYSNMAPYAVAFLLASNATTLTSFLPIVRSTFRTPYREQPKPWLVWTGAYALLVAAVAAETGFSNPVLFVYPVLNLILHVLVATLSVRKSLRGRLFFSNGLRRLYHDRSPIEGVGLFTRDFIPAGQPIWKMTGPVHLRSDTDKNPNFVGIGPGIWVDPDRPINRLNHSCAPNAAFGPRRQLYALRPIAPGGEITLDYSTTETDEEWVMDCHCGASTCREKLYAIHLAFADAAVPPPAAPLMQLAWAKRRVPGRLQPLQPDITPAHADPMLARVRRRPATAIGRQQRQQVAGSGRRPSAANPRTTGSGGQ